MDRLRGAWSTGKEWFHFCFETDSGPLLVNLLVQRRGDSREGIVTVLRPGDRAFAVQRRCERIVAHAGERVLRLDDSILSFEDDGAHLRLELPQLALDARLVPRARTTIPSSTHYGEGTLHWSVSPDCRVRGELTLGARSSALLPDAYVDHNWGDFSWGGATAWDWAYARTPSGVWVWMRMRRRNGGELGHALLCWERGHNSGTWVGSQLDMEWAGRWAGRSSATAPAALSHALPDRALGIPERLSIRGIRPDVGISFSPRSSARLVVPDDDAWGLTVIHEVDCDAMVERSGAVEHGRAIMEIVHGA